MLSAQLGSVAAAYALEHLGGLSHSYTWDEFKRRYQEALRIADAACLDSAYLVSFVSFVLMRWPA